MKNEILSFNIIYKKIKVDNIQNYQPLFFYKLAIYFFIPST